MYITKIFTMLGYYCNPTLTTYNSWILIQAITSECSKVISSPI